MLLTIKNTVYPLNILWINLVTKDNSIFGYNFKTILYNKKS